MNKSNHAIKRTQKRGISNIAIELLFAEGKIKYQKGGTALVVFPKSKKSRLKADCRSLPPKRLRVAMTRTVLLKKSF